MTQCLALFSTSPWPGGSTSKLDEIQEVQRSIAKERVLICRVLAGSLGLSGTHLIYTSRSGALQTSSYLSVFSLPSFQTC